MTTSSGNSVSTTQMQISGGGSEEVVATMDLRKRKRMQSNRESARRSRMRKQKQLDDVMAQVNQIMNDNTMIMSNLSITNQQYLNVEAENSILRAQMSELTQRLQALNEIIHSVNAIPPPPQSNFDIGVIDYGFGEYDDVSLQIDFTKFWNNNNMGYLNQQPIMASTDMFQY